MRAFRSKISVGLTIFILTVILLVALLLLQFADSTANLIITSAVLALTAALCLIPLFSIRYVVDGQMLHIECCFVFRSRFNIMDIKEISDTRTFLSAPAASLDRIRLRFRQGGDLIISPINKPEFIRLLCQINPEIIVK